MPPSQLNENKKKNLTYPDKAVLIQKCNADHFHTFFFTPPPLFGAFYIQVACEEVTFRGEKVERGQVIILKGEVNLLQKLKCQSFFNWIELSKIPK